jgi:hypothetical protein
MERPDGWVSQPIHENHAIDVMAAVVIYSEPIPDLLLNRVLKFSEDAAFAAGLRSRHPMVGVQVVWGTGGASSTSSPVAGRTFNSRFEGEESAAGRVAEQLQVAQNMILYRTWNYVSWAWQIERMKALMLPGIRAVQDTVSFAAQRLE